MFLKKKKKKKEQNKTKLLNDRCKQKNLKKKSTSWFSFFAIDGARLKVMLMKGIITFISSNHKIQVNLLGYLYGT